MTIKEIWDFITVEQRKELQAAVMMDGVSATTAYMYLTGQSKPLKLYKESIARHVRDIVDLDVPVAELFRV